MNISAELDEFDYDMLSDIMFEATNQIPDKEDIDNMLEELPQSLKAEIFEWGVCDTLTRDLLFDYLEV